MPASSMVHVELVNDDGAAQGKVDLPDGGCLAEALDKLIEDKKDRRTIVGARVVSGAEHVQGIEQDDGSKLADTFGPLHGNVSLSLKLLRKDDPESLQILRHSAAHLMADAIRKLWPETRLWVGPPVEDGFYYDVDCPHSITEEDFKAIEKEMKAVAKKKLRFERQQIKRVDALKRFKDEGDPYKVDLLERFTDEEVSLYTHGEFTDLCRGPHVFDTGYLLHTKLMKVAGAYWKGDANNKQLQRIYGTAFFDKESLDAHLHMLAEAEKRDHRRLGVSLNLYHQQEEAPGLVFWHPRGWALWQAVEQYMRRVYIDNGYQEVRAPQILDRSLWEKTGHWDNFRDNMFTTSSENRDYAVKPMNCPGHILIFNKGVRSYRELPLRFGEFGSCHRNEPSGSLHGLMRVRGFVQDDGHIFCTEDQIMSECVAYTALLQKVYKDFGFTNIIYRVALRPEKRIGADEMWDKAEAALQAALRQSGVSFQLSPGEGAFYGPKIEYSLKDALGRVWQCGTMQVDFSMPGRLGAEYVAEDNSRRTPVMLHRAIVGSFERFIGILIEEWAGAFPLWLSPVQVKVLPLTEKHVEYGAKVLAALRAAGVRAEGDFRNERIAKKIREAAINEKVPYAVVLGDEEESNNSVAVRGRGEGKDADLGSMSVDAFVAKVVAEAAARSN
ncbi:MAG: threonine--tRNA ligase [Planctomycetota bacterium]